MQGTGIELSVVIPLRDGAAYLPALLDSLAAQEWGGSWEVVVADNGSRDGGPELVARYGGSLPPLTVVPASGGEGSAYVRNVGAAAARGTSLVFIDHDDVVGEGYIAAMGEALRRHRLVCGRWEVEWVNPEWTYALQPSGQEDRPMLWNYDFLPYAAGGTLALRRELLDSIGGFDESVHYADCTDLCWRAQLDAGASLVFVPEAVIHYRYRQSLGAMFAQARRWGKAEVSMYARYRSRGLRSIPVGRSLRRWGFVVHLRRLRHRAGRAWWATQLGNRLGRLEGSVVERTLML